MTPATVVWRPQDGPQKDLIECPVFEVFFGGARGGGKTEGSLGDWLQHSAEHGVGAVGLFVRKTFKQLEEVVARSRQVFPLLGAKYNEAKAEWVMPDVGRGQGRLKFRYLERDADAEEYQGHSYTRVYVEEATNFASPEPINKLRATLRSPTGVPVGMRLTGNPGGPGHNWVKTRYISPWPGGYKILRESFKNPWTKGIIELERVFIPSKLTDNVLLMESDPGYVARLQQQGSKQLVEAWLTGNWDIVVGAFFDCFDKYKHVLDVEWLGKIPHYSLRFRAMDWGSAKPFSVGWYAVSDGEWGLPAGALVKYREWYGASAPNVGLKLYAESVAEGILEREKGEIIRYMVADPSMFIRDGGPSIAERMMGRGLSMQHGDRKRKTGWDQLRRYLVGPTTPQGVPLGEPMLYFLETCEDTIRTLPVLPHDDHDAEDVDTSAEDHAGDETRYAVMSRPWVQGVPNPDLDPIDHFKTPAQMTFKEIFDRHVEKRTSDREEMRI
jgi:hypothetical protein